MQRMQRKVGAFLPRTADDHQVGMLLADFQAADKMLETLIDASKTWRESWNSILTQQSLMLADYEGLYGNIVGKPDAVYAQTPQDQLDKVHGLNNGYIGLKEDMVEEIAQIDKQIVKPAQDARGSIKAYSKVISKREDKKLDWERYKGRVDVLQKKVKRTDRDDVALAKHQADLAIAQVAYEEADEQLKQTLPNITHATYSLLPHLLNAQIMIQNALLAQLYTVLSGYCADFGFSSDSLPAEEIVATFEADFTSFRIELESGIMTIAKGKAVKEPMGGSEKPKSYSGMNLRTNVTSRMPGAKKSPVPPAYNRQQIEDKPAYNQHQIEDQQASSEPPQLALATRPRIPSTTNSYAKSPGGYLSPSPSNVYRSTSPSAAQGGADYFANTSASHIQPSGYNSAHAINNLRRPSATSQTSLSSMASSIASKKKPPPPPPKRLPSQQFEYVTAIYDFAGDADGDLPLREGDRVKIVKKTASTDDWWEGECRGVRGSFPANYCQMSASR